MPVRREDVGASAGGQSWGLCQPGEGVWPLGDLALPCSPPRSRSFRLARRERGRSQGELDAAFGQRRRSDLTAQSTPLRTPRHRGSTVEVESTYPRGTYGLEKRGDGPGYPQ